MRVTNTSGVDTDLIHSLPKLGEVPNNWRGRHVTVYPHPDPKFWNTVITVDVGRDETVICAESRHHYAKRINCNVRSTDT